MHWLAKCTSGVESQLFLQLKAPEFIKFIVKLPKNTSHSTGTCMINVHWHVNSYHSATNLMSIWGTNTVRKNSCSAKLTNWRSLILKALYWTRGEIPPQSSSWIRCCLCVHAVNTSFTYWCYLWLFSGTNARVK